MALWMVAGLVVSDGKNRSSARLTVLVRVARNVFRSKALAAGIKVFAENAGILAEFEGKFYDCTCMDFCYAVWLFFN